MDRRDMARKGMSLEQIADEEGISTTGIRKWFYRRDLTYWAHTPANFETIPRGYERWSHKYQGTSEYAYVHRLVAVAEYGVDAVESKHIHHKNGIPWDNRPENIEPVSPGEHMSESHDPTEWFPDPEDRTRASGGHFIEEQ
jgi:hypothetical protein